MTPHEQHEFLAFILNEVSRRDLLPDGRLGSSMLPYKIRPRPVYLDPFINEDFPPDEPRA